MICLGSCMLLQLLKLLQCAPEILTDSFKIQLRGAFSGNNRINCRMEPVFIQSVTFSNKALDVISHNSTANLAAGGNSYSGNGACTRQTNYNKMSSRKPLTFTVCLKELAPTEQPLTFWKGMEGFFSGQLFGGNRYRKSFTPFSATTLYDKASVFCRHPDEKSVSSFSRCVTGLKCAFHLPAPRMFSY